MKAIKDGSRRHCWIDEAFDKAMFASPALGALPPFDVDEMLTYRVGHLPAVDQVGQWRLRVFEVGEETEDFYYDGRLGNVMPRGVYMGLYRGEDHGRENLWMCDTPPEVASMLPALRRFRETDCNRVLIGGLGLGVLLQAALREEHVEKVDVVELRPEVIELVGPYYEDPRLTIHEGDAFEFLPVGAWDYAYYDVWRDVTAANCADFLRIKALVGGQAREVEFWHREWAEWLLEAEAESHDVMADTLRMYRELMACEGFRA